MKPKWDTERSNTERGLLKRFPLVAYFGLAYAISMNYSGFLSPFTMRARVTANALVLVAVVLIVILAGPARLTRRSGNLSK